MVNASVAPVGFVLPPAYPITGLGVASVALLHIYHFVSAAKHRKQSGVKYPNLYATDAEAKADPKKHIFNCVQRAHANTVENLPIVLSMFGYLSLFYPQFATGALVTWALGRFFYASGYATGNPEARNFGLARLQYIGLFSLLGGSFYTAAVAAAALYLK